jgi:hypothetical protein
LMSYIATHEHPEDKVSLLRQLPQTEEIAEPPVEVSVTLEACPGWRQAPSDRDTQTCGM